MTFSNLPMSFFIYFFIIFFFIYISMSKTFSAKYYQKSKERLACGRYQNLSKVKKQQYGHERYKNLSEDERQKLIKYRKKILYNEKNTLL